MASPKQVRAKKRPLSVMRRAMLHSLLCFLVGLIAGPTINNQYTSGSMMSSILLHRRSPPLQEQQQPQLLVVVTATELSDPERRAAGLTRTAHALRLVPPPVLWLVVEEPAADTSKYMAPLLRGAGVVYRHLTYRDNFTDARAEWHHQRNVALGHVEEHRLAGVVLFAGLGDVYDLRFFRHLREISTLGVWRVATVQYERKVVVEGPVCAGSVVTGWFSTSTARSPTSPPAYMDMDVRGFGFSSSLLWDSRRWDRFPITQPDASQDSLRFVQRLVVEEYNKSRGIPDPDCSQIMVWRGDHLLATYLDRSSSLTNVHLYQSGSNTR